MDEDKLNFLFQYLPTLKSVVNHNDLSIQQKKCITYIYYYYYKIIYLKQKIRKNFNFMSDKAELRSLLKKKRLEISVDKLKNASLVLNNRVIKSQIYKQAKTIFCYISFNKEIGTYNILKHCLNHNKVLCVPKLINNIMQPCQIIDLKHLNPNQYGILEPVDNFIVDKDKIDLAIVPGLGFNPLGYRLGYGGGYYDRYLADFKGKSISITLQEFVINKFIPEKYDQPVDRLFIL